MVKKFYLILLLGVWLGFFIASNATPALAEEFSQVSPIHKYHPKMESVLGMLVEKYKNEGKIPTQDLARKKGIFLEDDRVTVILEPLSGYETSVIDEAHLLSLGVLIEARSRHFLRAKVSLLTLEEVAEKVAGVGYIRLPLKPLPLVVQSEGVQLTGASGYHNKGYKGENVKIAVIDSGFMGLAAAQTAGELPTTVITKDYTGEGMESDTNHGTAVAEIVYDMAPSATLYLIKIEDEVDLENAKDWCVNQGVDIVNHSMGWVNSNFTDGSGKICGIANDARSKGILWVNSAGNAAKKHYQAVFTDDDQDNWHEFFPQDEGNTINHYGGYVAIFLTWDAWPVTDQDYDLYLFDDNGNFIAASINSQTGTQPPTEAIWEYLSPGTYHIAVYKYSATLNHQIKIFTFYDDLEYRTAAHSLMSPADASGVLAVAAIDQDSWNTGPQEDFSSQGPTNDGRTKPDIAGPDGVSTFTYGATNFFGTSASSPHVAGAAALVLSRYASYTPDQLQNFLENSALDMGTPGKDNIYGWGRLYLAGLPASTLDNLIVYPNPFNSRKGHTKIVFENLTDRVRIQIFTLSGEKVYDTQLSGKSKWEWTVKNVKGEKLARGIYIYLVTSPTGEKKEGKIAIIN